MLILAHNREDLRMSELAELYGNDLQVPWQDDLPAPGGIYRISFRKILLKTGDFAGNPTLLCGLGSWWQICQRPSG